MSTRIAFLGLGAMGSRMADRLLQAGHALTVWNRRPEAAAELVAAGARQAATPREAAEGADFVISMVRDDEASWQVWCDPVAGALAGMKAGAVAIESSTLSPAGIRRLAEAADAAGVRLLDAPVSGSRPAAKAGQLVYLVGGDADAFSRAEPVLLAMGASVRHVGATGHGALAKLVTNTLLGLQVTALAELIGLLRHQGVSPESVLQAVSATPAWAPVNHYLSSSMLAADFAPQFPVALIAKDFGYALAAGGGADRMPMAAAALSVYEQASRQGLADANMTAVAQLYDGAQSPSA